MWVSFIIALGTTMVTEVASNTATANILVPILSQMSKSLCTNPLYLMLPAAVIIINNHYLDEDADAYD